MVRQHEFLQSRALGRGVHLWRYGHFGMPLLVFPSASGMAHEWQSHGIVDSLADLLDGRLELSVHTAAHPLGAVSFQIDAPGTSPIGDDR